MDAFKQDIPVGITTEQSDNPPAYSTVVKWVGSLGLKHDSAKLYYVDGHEKPEQQEYRAHFINQYLTKSEPQFHSWVQLTAEELQHLESTRIQRIVFLLKDIIFRMQIFI